MPRVTLIAPLALMLMFTPAAHGAPRPNTPTRPARAHNVAAERRLDINALNLFVTNFGNVGFDAVTYSSGLLFPRGTYNSLLYSGGLWVGGLVGGEPRLAVAEYSSEYGPGSMSGTTFDDPSLPEFVVWKVKTWTGDPADTVHAEHTPEEIAADPTMDPIIHHSWAEYMANAAPHGAPVRMWTLPGPGGVGTQEVAGPDVMGDQMLWCVFNDAYTALHTNIAGSTAPLGIEVRQTVWGFNREGPLSQTAFVRWRIVNHSQAAIDSARVAFWLDPDLGGATDDLVACDSIRSLGITYNATNADLAYGANPPALGVDLMDDALDSTHGRVLGMASFERYLNGTDPSNAGETWNILRGARRDGSPIVDPITLQPLNYDVPGDPVQDTGFLDSDPSDRRMLMVRSPRLIAPGDSVDVTAAIIVAQGGDRLASVSIVKCWDDWVQTAYVAGFPPDMPLTSCALPGNCPRTSSFYQDECQGAGHLSVAQLQLLTTAVRNSVNSDLLPNAQGADAFCWLMGNADNARLAAMREFATLIANLRANLYGIVPSGTTPIVLHPDTHISIPGFTAATLGELITPGSTALEFTADYLDLEPAHPTALAGVNFGLRAFSGGADYAFDFLGSTLDPNVLPADSFPTVQLLFDAAHPQKAYRYLRLEQVDGSLPTNGREYRFGGFFDVPFIARDSVSGQQLEVAFVERTVSDADGTILDPSFQLATFDSTWAPDASDLGSREYMMVLHRPYTGSPDPEVAQDGAFIGGYLPWLYALWAKLVTPSSVIDAGDQFVFTHHHPSGPGVDQRLLDLEGLSLGDPGVIAAYDAVTQALDAINHGVGIPVACDQSVAALASLVDASAQPGRVDLDWYVSGISRVTVQRSVPEGDWTTVAMLDADGSGHVRWQDASVEAGQRYGYRLEFADGVAVAHSQAVWVDVPTSLRLAIAGFRPNPSGAMASVAFTLAGREHATLALMDVSGRRVFAREVGAMGPGVHTLALGQPLAPGIYWLHLSQAGASATTRGVIIR